MGVRELHPQSCLTIIIIAKNGAYVTWTHGSFEHVTLDRYGWIVGAVLEFYPRGFQCTQLPPNSY